MLVLPLGNADTNSGHTSLIVNIGVHLNLALKSRSSICRVKTQTTKKLRLDLNSSLSVHN
jgi:hypothetical protein